MMGFVNEYISSEDAKAFHLEEIDQNYVVGGTRARSWTIDRDQNCYLRWVANDREEASHQSTWNLYLRGKLFEIGIDTLNVERDDQDNIHSTKRIRYCKSLTNTDFDHKSIIAEFKRGLEAYKDGGVYSIARSYCLTLLGSSQTCS